MDILRMLEQLNEMAVMKPKTYLGFMTFGLNQEEIAMQIAKIRASLPSELKQAAQTVRESERIVASASEDAAAAMNTAQKESERLIYDARKEADRIVEQARIQQERMLADSEVLKLAKAQSEEIRVAADRDAVQMRRGAEKYAHDVLTQLEGVVGKVMTTIERGKQELDRVETQQQLPRDRGRALGGE